jgi:hypothetical protein
MRTTRRFLDELSDLRNLYHGTIYAYQQAVVHVMAGCREGLVDPRAPIASGLWGLQGEVVIARDPKHLRRLLYKWFPPHLREVVFVRAISILEVYLTRLIRELFVVRPDLFKTDESLQLSYAQVLGYGRYSSLGNLVLSADIRKLRNRGFAAVTEYYKRRFGVEFAHFGADFALVEEFHDRRHLLVHRLGRTDQQYRKKYGVAAKRVEVGRSYLSRVFTGLQAFAQFVDSEAAQLGRASPGWVDAREPTGVANIVVRSTSKSGKQVLRPDFLFEHDEGIVALRDLVVSRQVDEDGTQHIQLQGDIDQIQNYISHLQERAEGGRLELKECRVKRLGKARRVGLTDEFLCSVVSTMGTVTSQDGWKRELAEQSGAPVERIGRALEEITLAERISDWLRTQDWVSGIHYHVAARFRIENSRAHRILRRMRRGLYWNWPNT